jgi:hypothetical protein
LHNSRSRNRYAYCLNNPLRYIDPTGHWDEKENSSGGFGGHGIGNPGSYGGNGSVGAPGFGDGYASGYDDRDSSIRDSRTRSHIQRASYDMKTIEADGLYSLKEFENDLAKKFRKLLRIGK